MIIPTLQTDRLILRPPEASDFPVYRAFYADADASAHYGGPLDAPGAWRKLAADIGHWHLRGYGMWSVVARGTGAMVGGCGIIWPEGWPRPELTWWIVPVARRQGYALEASRAAISWACGVHGWPEVETHMKDENVPARLLAEKLGGTIIARETFPDGLDRNVFALPRPALPGAAVEASPGQRQSLAHLALIVRDYDEAIAWFTGVLGFTLVADYYQPEQDKRWVLVAPPGAGDSAATLLLPSSDRLPRTPGRVEARP